MRFVNRNKTAINAKDMEGKALSKTAYNSLQYY